MRLNRKGVISNQQSAISNQQSVISRLAVTSSYNQSKKEFERPQAMQHITDY